MGGSVESRVFEEVYSICCVEAGHDFGVGKSVACRFEKPCFGLSISFAESASFGTALAVRVGFVTYKRTK